VTKCSDSVNFVTKHAMEYTKQISRGLLQPNEPSDLGAVLLPCQLCVCDGMVRESIQLRVAQKRENDCRWRRQTL